MTSRSETRADALPEKRDEVAAQLERLAALVRADKWQEAGPAFDVMQDGFTSVFTRWNALRFKRNIERNEVIVDIKLPEGLTGAEVTAMVNDAIRASGWPSWAM